MIDVSLERADLRLWVASAAVILALHASAGLLLLNWHDPLTGDEGTEAIVVDLAPFTGPSADTKQRFGAGTGATASRACARTTAERTRPKGRGENRAATAGAECRRDAAK